MAHPCWRRLRRPEKASGVFDAPATVAECGGGERKCNGGIENVAVFSRNHETLKVEQSSRAGLLGLMAA